MRVKVLIITCLALCLATAVSAQAAEPVVGTVSTGPPEGALQDGGFMAAQAKPNAPVRMAKLGGVSTAETALAGCWFTALSVGRLGSSLLATQTFRCGSAFPYIRASGCINRYQPNNYVWYAIGCNATVGSGTAYLSIYATYQGCYTYQAWGSFTANGPFQYTGGPWVSGSRWICG